MERMKARNFNASSDYAARKIQPKALAEGGKKCVKEHLSISITEVRKSVAYRIKWYRRTMNEVAVEIAENYWEQMFIVQW